MEALLFQIGLSGPLVVAAIVHTASSGTPGLVRRYLLALLWLILLWMLGMGAQGLPDAQLQRAGELASHVPASFMAPVLCLLMLLHARVELFETRREARWAVLAPFWLFLAAFWSHDFHGLMIDSNVLAPGGMKAEPGVLFWSFQVWTNLAAGVGLGTCAWIARTSRSPRERRRMALLCVGIAMPLGFHLLFTLQLLPLGYPLTPASLGITSLLVVAAIRRYRLLELQPIARRDVIEASRDGVLIADDDALLVDWNPMAARLLGEEGDRLRGRPLADLFDALGPERTSRRLAEMMEALKRGETPASCELEDRGDRILEIGLGIARGESGDTAGYFVVLRDRTRERRTERLLQHSQRLESVGILAAGVAHEVNNPLAFVRANLAYLSEGTRVLEARQEDLPKDLAEQTRDFVDVIDETLIGLDRIQGIVEGLLGLSRTASEQVGRCDLNATVTEAARFASLDADPGLRVDFRLAESLPEVEASPDRLVQVFLNLFLNAREALRGARDGRILAESRVAEGWIEVDVSDNGPGISEAVRDRIFDPFFTTRPPNEGTGLGLPIAFDIVREHGGSLELDPSFQAGARFVVRLPMGSGAGHPGPSEQRAEPQVASPEES